MGVTGIADFRTSAVVKLELETMSLPPPPLPPPTFKLNNITHLFSLYLSISLSLD